MLVSNSSKSNTSSRNDLKQKEKSTKKIVQEKIKTVRKTVNTEKKKELKVNKNSRNQRSCFINKIKAHDILVFCFLIIFFFIGYFSFSLNANKLMNGNMLNKKGDGSISKNNAIITLTADDIMSDGEGLKSVGYSLGLDNETNSSYSYSLVLEENSFIQDLNDCVNSIDISNIRYSFDGVNVKTLGEDMVLLNDEVKGDESKKYSLHIWINNNVELTDSDVYYGNIRINKKQ